MGFMLFLLVFLGRNMFNPQVWLDPEISPVIRAIYACGSLLYFVIIPVYIVVVIQLLRRINQLKKTL